MQTPAARPPTPILGRLREAAPALARQLSKFGVVGACAYVIDVSVFNVLLYGTDALADQPIWAKVISSAVATVASWLGNRYWTFRHTRRPHPWRELALFVVMCTIGLGLSLLCLTISHYVLGLHSAVADNVAANVVGLAVGTAFRFWAYRRFVFTHAPDSGIDPLVTEPGAEPELTPGTGRRAT